MKIWVANEFKQLPRGFWAVEDVIENMACSRATAYRLMRLVPDEYKLRVYAYDRLYPYTVVNRRVFLESVKVHQKGIGNPLFSNPDWQRENAAKRKQAWDQENHSRK